jgi:hypothetical protein
MTLSRRRRITIRALLGLATILTIAAIFALWANRQVLNPDNWSETSTAIIQDDAVRTQLSEYLVDQLYTDVDVQSSLAGNLPPALAPLAGPLSGALRTLAERVANRAMDRPRVQQVWKEANRLTAKQFVAIAEGDSKAITANGNAVVLDLRVELVDLAERLGLPPAVVGQIPPTAGRIKIMSADQVSVAQDVVGAVRGLAIILPAAALALFALAIFLATGRRRRTLLWAGIDLVIAGALVLIGRNLAGDALLNSLVTDDAVRPAAANAWAIGSAMLQDIAQATIVIGIPALFAAWLAGPTSAAVSARRAMAPTLRDHPGASYAAAGGLVLLIVAWGPIHATRLVIPVLLFLGLTLLGTAALRRQVAEEFPPTQLQRLESLHDRGSLTDAEFTTQAAALANGGQHD